MKGVKRALHADHIGWSLIWIFAVVFGLIVGLVQVYLLFSTFFEYPRAQTEDSLYEEVSFPAVTVCNMQPLSSDTNPNETVNKKIVDDFYHQVKEFLNQSPQHLQGTLKSLFSPIGFFQNTEEVDVTKISHGIKNLVPYCQWESSDPDLQNNTCASMSRFLHPSLFNCYTIGSVETSLIHSGHWGKLILIVYLDDFLDARLETYQEFHPWSDTENAQGARVTFHFPKTLPQPLVDGYSVSPGNSYKFNVKVTKHRRLGEPFSNCTDTQEMDVKSCNYNEFNCLYTASTCSHICLQRAIMEKCKCIDAKLPIPGPIPGPIPSSYLPSMNYCGVIKNKNHQKIYDNLNCLKEMYSESEVCSKTCSSPCTEYHYSLTQSEAVWPHEPSHLSFYEHMIQNQTYGHKFKVYEEINEVMKTQPVQGIRLLKNTTLIKRNFLQINVLLDNTELKLVKETEVFEPVNLIANIGGMLNLWIGVTYITLFELGELLWRLLCALCNTEAQSVPTRDEELHSIRVEESSSKRTTPPNGVAL